MAFAPYFVGVVCKGNEFANTLWATALILSQVLVVLLSPWLGTVADLTAQKKRFLLFSAIICCFFTALLATSVEGRILWVMCLVIGANFGFSMGENFCASFLPEISHKGNVGKISGYGWSFGYCGGLFSLVMGIIILNFYSGRESEAVPYLCVLTACFFAASSLPTFLLLKERKLPAKGVTLTRAWNAAWREIIHTSRQLEKHRELSYFLSCYAIYMSGLSAIFAFAAVFATQVLGFNTEENLMLFASLQLSSALGAFAFGFFQDQFGSKTMLMISLLIWVGVCFGAFASIEKWHFFVVGNFAGFVVGSTQAGSRAVVSLMSPKGDEGQVFGYWGLFGKLAAIIGYLSMGALADFIGFRWAVFWNSLFFIMGFLLLSKLKLKTIES